MLILKPVQVLLSISLDSFYQRPCKNPQKTYQNSLYNFAEQKGFGAVAWSDSLGTEHLWKREQTGAKNHIPVERN